MRVGHVEDHLLHPEAELNDILRVLSIKKKKNTNSTLIFPPLALHVIFRTHLLIFGGVTAGEQAVEDDDRLVQVPDEDAVGRGLGRRGRDGVGPPAATARAAGLRAGGVPRPPRAVRL